MRSAVNFWVLTLLTVAIVFINLGNIPLLDPDEPVYAETPREMIQMNDYISPRIYGDVWYDKPPMYYWLVAGSFKLLGVNEYAARFPSAVLGVLGVLLVYGAAAKLFNERTGFAGGLVLATSLEYFYLCKAAVTDITLTFCLTAALLFFLGRQYYLFYLFSALATLTKGPIGFLFPGAIIILWLAVTRNFSELRRMKIPAGAVLFAAVAVPWYWLMYELHGTAFINGFIGVNNVTRFLTPEHAKTAAWYFFIPVLAAGFFPWTSLLPQAVKAVFRHKESESYPALLFLVIWAAFIFVFFSLSSTKLVTYILPVFPPLAILVGWYLDRCAGQFSLKGEGLVWPVGLTLLTALLVGGIATGSRLVPAVGLGAGGLSVVLVLMTAATWYFLRRREVFRAAMGQAVLMAVAAVFLVTVLFPPVVDTLSMRATAQSFTANYDGKSPVYVQKFLHPGFAFYTGQFGKEVNSDEDIKQVIEESGKAYLVVKKPLYQGLDTADRQAVTVLAESGDRLLLIKQ